MDISHERYFLGKFGDELLFQTVCRVFRVK